MEANVSRIKKNDTMTTITYVNEIINTKKLDFASEWSETISGNP